MDNMCLNCNLIWQDTVRHHYCQKCIDYLTSLKFDSSITVIKKVMLDNGKSIRKGHLEDIQSRVIDDSGNAIKGREGLSYMKSKGDKYAGRLKSYYEPKI